ncbi:MAG: ABC transporter ATP-binding protein [Alsobacter sp.]
MDAPLVRLSGVDKSFEGPEAGGPETRALRGFDLVVRAGEFVSLLGPSGCGKTTALRLIAGLETPDAGVIEGAALDAREGGLGFVFQEPTLMPWASAADNVWLPLRLAGLSRRQALPRIEALLELVGVADFRDALPHTLSGGMKMRVALARALVTRPRLLLMDEPFAALDEITRLRLNDDLLRLQRETSCTIVFVTHSIYESAYLSTRLAVMSRAPGRVVAEIPIDLPLLRDEGLRRDPRYLAACEAASRALAAAMAGAEPGA